MSHSKLGRLRQHATELQVQDGQLIIEHEQIRRRLHLDDAESKDALDALNRELAQSHQHIEEVLPVSIPLKDALELERITLLRSLIGRKLSEIERQIQELLKKDDGGETRSKEQ
ncbi:MAG: hypothetical protein AAB489_02985 [Patescibacteria group bacterium]